MDIKLDKKLKKLNTTFITTCLDEAIDCFKENSEEDNEEWYKFWIKVITLKKLVYEDKNKVYNFFTTIDVKLYETFKINSGSKIEDYQRMADNYTHNDDERINHVEIKTKIDAFFNFRDNFGEFEGHDKLFKKLVYA